MIFRIVICVFFFSLFSGSFAQRGIGFRFASDFNYFFRAEEHPLIEGWFSTGVFGAYYQAYFENGGFQAGLQIAGKNGSGRGFPNLPVVMKDYGADSQNVGTMALEFELKCGPRFGAFNPRFGAILGYRLKQNGFLKDTTGDPRINRMYFALPFGCSVELPTGYGSIGFGAYFDIGLTNVIHRPDNFPAGDFNGSRQRALSAEITVLFASGEQKPKKPKNAP